MHTTKIFKTLIGAVLLPMGLLTAHAQTTATWIGPASGGEWNTGANWSTLLPPADATTNAIISVTTNVNYNFPMAAAAFGGLTNNGTLNINTNGFNCASIYVDRAGGGAQLLISNGAVMNVTGNIGVNSNCVITVSSGATVTAGSLLIGCGTTGGTGSTTVGSYGKVTVNGGLLNFTTTTMNPGNASVTASPTFIINGGTNNLGAFLFRREQNPPPANSGFIVSNGYVNTTSITLGDAGSGSWGSMYLVGGFVTNAGAFTIQDNTSARPGRFLQTGGLYVSTDPNVVTLSPSGNATAAGVYSVTGGTNIINGLVFGTAANIGTAFFTNGGTIYLGSGGIVSNGVVTVSASLNDQGLFGAYADWTNAAPLTLNSGVFTFQAADAAGTAHNIYSSGILRGTGTLKKTGTGTLTLGAANTYTASTLVMNGTLALDVNGSLASTPIIVGSGATFDVSLVSGGYTLASSKTLAGSGVVTGAVTVATGGIINPGSNTLNGILSFSNSVTETGGAINHFDLAGAPSPNNDLIVIAGDFDVSGTNMVDIGGASLQTGSTYTLIKYGGNFNGGLTNFVVTSAIGTLTNDSVAKTISFIPQTTLRGPTNIVWIGNPVNTNWDTEVSTNWVNNGALDFFVPGDNVQFTDLGATNVPVNVVGTVTPGSILFNSHSNYIIASTSGGVIGGSGGLTVTNSGTLTILTTNTYSGVTTINGGVLAVTQLANGLTASAIGAASSDPANLVINSGTFNYSGPTVSIDRGATLNSTNSTVDVSTNGTLTLGGTISGTGGLTKIDNGTLILSGANNYAGFTTLSNGTLQVSGSSSLGANTVNFDGGTLSLASAASQQFYANVFNIVTSGTIIFGGANGNNVIGTTGGTGSITGMGILNIDVPNAGVYCTINENIESFAGTFHLTDDSLGFFRLDSGGSSSGAQICTGSTNATFDLGNGGAVFINRNGGGTSFGNYDLGALTGGTSTFLKGSASASSASTYSIGANNLSTTFAGTIANGTGGSGATVNITKVGTGVFTLTGNNTYSGATTISNGILALAYNPTNSSDGSIGNSANINIVAGGVLDVSERSDATLLLSSSQVISGNGTLRGILDTTGGGTVSPGGGINGALGILTVTNNINLGGIAWMKINHANTPNSDRLVSSTASIINYGGTLLVTNTGARLQVGDTFTLFSASSLPGSFNLQLPTYYIWDTSQLSVNGSITVTGAFFPAITRVDFSDLANGNLYLYATNGQPGGSVDILTTTNLALPISQWMTNTSTGFDGNGQINHFYLNVDPTLPQQFIILHGY